VEFQFLSDSIEVIPDEGVITAALVLKPQRCTKYFKDTVCKYMKRNNISTA